MERLTESLGRWKGSPKKSRMESYDFFLGVVLTTSSPESSRKSIIDPEPILLGFLDLGLFYFFCLFFLDLASLSSGLCFCFLVCLVDLVASVSEIELLLVRLLLFVL